MADLDVVLLDDAPLPLRGRVIHDRRVICSRDEPLRVAYESRTAREFTDFQIHAAALDRELLARHAEDRRGWWTWAGCAPSSTGSTRRPASFAGSPPWTSPARVDDGRAVDVLRSRLADLDDFRAALARAIGAADPVS